MTDAVIFLGGFIMGGLTVFIVTAVTIWKPRLDELLRRAERERDRRIEAEDSAHAEVNEDVRVVGEWPPIAEMMVSDE